MPCGEHSSDFAMPAMLVLSVQVMSTLPPEPLPAPLPEPEPLPDPLPLPLPSSPPPGCIIEPPKAHPEISARTHVCRIAAGSASDVPSRTSRFTPARLLGRPNAPVGIDYHRLALPALLDPRAHLRLERRIGARALRGQDE